MVTCTVYCWIVSLRVNIYPWVEEKAGCALPVLPGTPAGKKGVVPICCTAEDILIHGGICAAGAHMCKIAIHEVTPPTRVPSETHTEWLALIWSVPGPGWGALVS